MCSSLAMLDELRSSVIVGGIGRDWQSLLHIIARNRYRRMERVRSINECRMASPSGSRFNCPRRVHIKAMIPTFANDLSRLREAKAIRHALGEPQRTIDPAGDVGRGEW